MAKERGTSVAPMVLGIVGAALQVPGSLCAGICAGVGEMANEGSDAAQAAAAQGTLWFGVLAAIFGLVGGIMGKKNPKASGILLLIATLGSGAIVWQNLFMNFLVDAACLCFLIGGILAFTQKKEAIVEQQQ